MLDIEGLTLSYGSTRILSEISLPPLEAGRIVGILGANGAGKSTFLNALAGHHRYTGSVRKDGRQVQAMSSLERAATIGFMPQVPPSASGFSAYELAISACRSCRPDLSLGNIEAATEETFALLGLSDFAFRQLRQMSGGQRQLVGLALTLIRAPDLILLDEPSSALDLQWQVTAFRVLRERLSERRCLCLVALHDINLALRHCDRVAVFAAGRLLSFGKPDEAITPATLREAYGVEGRIETCSKGTPIVVIDNSISEHTDRL